MARAIKFAKKQAKAGAPRSPLRAHSRGETSPTRTPSGAAVACLSVDETAPPFAQLGTKDQDIPLIAHGAPDWHSLVCAVGGAVLYFAVGLISLAFFSVEGTLATIWLPSAGAVALLLLTNPRNEIGFYLAHFPASVLANFLSGTPFEFAFVYSLANLAIIALVTWLVRRHSGRSPDMSDPPTLMRFVWIGGFIGPLTSATLSTLLVQAISSDALGLAMRKAPASSASIAQTFFDCFLTESMGMILIVPTILLVHQGISRRPFPSGRRLLEASAFLTGSVICTLTVFGQSSYPLMFLILPMTLIHAFRLGSVGTALHVTLVAALALSMTWAGHGPIVETSASPSVQLHLIQAFIAANLLTGLPIAAILSGRDRLTKALVEGRRELALLANSITDAVLKVDSDGVCTYASPAVRDVLGEEPEAIVGRPLDKLTQEDAGQRIADMIESLLSGSSEKERLTYRRRRDDADGVPVFIEADCAIAFDPITGSREGVIISARDVTERVELELLLTRARRHAENAASAKSDFLANMSHEIRTPMNGVLGFAELMLQGDLGPDELRYTEMIVESGRSMMLLLNDILDLSKIEAGQIVIDKGPIDLHATLDECLALHRPSAKKRGLELTLTGDGADQSSSMPMVVTDGLRLRQIALNLIGNAVKFTESGRVQVGYRFANGQLQVRVKDTGIGISPARVEQIFHPFTQGEKETARRFGGTGLGLTISRQLAELLGGGIDVESVPGVGSVFTLTLPATSMEREPPAARETPAVIPEDLPQHARILLVEDHDVNRLLVTEMLERCGQSVDIAHDGNEAISMVMDSVVRDRAYDLVLMDVQMPDCDGYEATRAIREAGIGPDLLPIIALTANAFPEDVAAAKEAGMQAHLAKPIDFAHLAQALQRWLPIQIVEAPMDRDVVSEECGSGISLDPGKGENRNPMATQHPDREPTSSHEGKDNLYARWLQRREETIEAVRQGLAEGLISNTNKRRSRDRTDREDLVRSIHKLAGTAAAFGEPELGEQAAELERAMGSEGPSEECETIAFALLALADEPPRELSKASAAAG